MATKSDQQYQELKVDPKALYLEEIFTDRRVGTIRRLTHIGRSGPIDVAEQRKHQSAENSYPDQRQLERRRP